MVEILVTFSVTACADAERHLPAEVVDHVISEDSDARAAKECAQTGPNSTTSHLDAAWGGTSAAAIELADGFDSKNADPVKTRNETLRVTWPWLSVM